MLTVKKSFIHHFNLNTNKIYFKLRGSNYSIVRRILTHLRVEYAFRDIIFQFTISKFFSTQNAKS